MATTQRDVGTFVAGLVLGAVCVYGLLLQGGGSIKEDDPSRLEPSKQQESTADDNKKKTPRPTLEDVMKQNNNKLEIQAIGMIRSVYRLCVGTPRQGLLAPHARGRLDLELSADAVDGLADYSHVWIFFVFHLNTLPQTKKRGVSPMKIAPPALGGKKIGVLASRSPHRPNPVGVTLARLDRIETTGNGCASLHLSGLDLVDGTPVVDIKPYVPTYDAATPCHVPDWVAGGLALRRSVTFSDRANQQLTTVLEGDPNALQFYGGKAESTKEALDAVRSCIKEVLSIDVRSEWQTRKARKGKFQAERADRLQRMTPMAAADDGSSGTVGSASECTQQLDNLLIRFCVDTANDATLERATSKGSGAEDGILVTAIELFAQNR